MSLAPLSIKHFSTRLWSRYGRAFLRKHYVFVNTDTDKLDFSRTAKIQIRKYSSAEELSKDQWSELKNIWGEQHETVARGQFQKHCRLYLLTIDNTIASSGWVVSGRDLTEWWVQIEPDDFVMFSAYTVSPFRGQRLWGKILAAAYSEESRNGGNYYCDCNVANIASKKQLLRSGFEIISKERRLKALKQTTLKL